MTKEVLQDSNSSGITLLATQSWRQPVAWLICSPTLPVFFHHITCASAAAVFVVPCWVFLPEMDEESPVVENLLQYSLVAN